MVELKSAEESSKCLFPNCASNEIALEQVRQHQEINKQLVAITSGQTELIKSVNQMNVLLADINHLTEDFKDFREQSRKAHENIFQRLGSLEAGKADKSELLIAQNSIQALIVGKSDKSDVTDIQRTGLSWIWQSLMLIAAAVIGYVSSRLGSIK